MKRRDFIKASLAGSAASAVPVHHLFAASAAASSAIVTDIPAINLSGAETTLEKAALTELADSLRGNLIIAGHDEYDHARRVWNAMIDKRPAVIVRCAGAADIQNAVTFARERQLLLAVRGGGHSIPGKSTCNGGMVIDLSPINAVRVDPDARTARAGPGALGGALDHESQHHGLATPLGTVSHTGIAGLTLGGGIGWLSRQYGLACDNLASVDLVTADGQLRRLSEDENPDLFWAVRGGGGNFGVVSSFEYQLHNVDPTVIGGRIVYPLSDLRRALEFYTEFSAQAPRELAVDLVIEKPPGSVLGVVFYVCYMGKPSDSERVLAPLRNFGKPIEDTIGRKDYLTVQQQFDGPSLSPASVYIKSGFLTELSNGFIDALVEEYEPRDNFSAYLWQQGGAIGDRSPTDTAFTHRDMVATIMISGWWMERAEAEQNVADIRANWDTVKEYTKGFYVNLNEDNRQKTHSNYGENFSRLQAIKREADPGNLFCLNANIEPA